MEARLERSRFTSNTKAVLKDFLKAARNGLQQRDCSAIYYKCPIAVGTETTRSVKTSSESKTELKHHDDKESTQNIEPVEKEP